jgi:hypothetical protein
MGRPTLASMRIENGGCCDNRSGRFGCSRTWVAHRLSLALSACVLLSACGDGVVHHVSAYALPLPRGLRVESSREETDASDAGLDSHLFARYDFVVSATLNAASAKREEEAWLMAHGWRRDPTVRSPADTFVSPDQRVAAWLETLAEIADIPASRSAYFSAATRRHAASLASDNVGSFVAGLEGGALPVPAAEVHGGS